MGDTSCPSPTSRGGLTSSLRSTSDCIQRRGCELVRWAGLCIARRVSNQSCSQRGTLPLVLTDRPEGLSVGPSAQGKRKKGRSDPDEVQSQSSDSEMAAAGVSVPSRKKLLFHDATSTKRATQQITKMKMLDTSYRCLFPYRHGLRVKHPRWYTNRL